MAQSPKHPSSEHHCRAAAHHQVAAHHHCTRRPSITRPRRTNTASRPTTHHDSTRPLAQVSGTLTRPRLGLLCGVNPNNACIDVGVLRKAGNSPAGHHRADLRQALLCKRSGAAFKQRD